MEINKDFQIGNSNVMIVIDNKRFANIAGMGELYDEFMKSKQFIHFTGKDSEAKIKDDQLYKNSLLRIVKFDETFAKLHTSPKQCKLNWMYYNFIFKANWIKFHIIVLKLGYQYIYAPIF